MYLIDTYNLLHAAIPLGGSVANLTVRSLCQWIASSPGNMKATLVLDGRAKPDEPSENEFPHLSLIYSGAGVSADKVIAQTVERAQHKKKITVVSNDRAVILHARRHGASAISCEEFLSILTGQHHAHRRAAKAQLPASKMTGTGSPGETSHWLKEFGMTAPPKVDEMRPRPVNPDELSDDEIERLMGGPPDSASS